MANSSNIYQTYHDETAGELRFSFRSTGIRDIVKMVQYTYARDFEGKRIFNLGFGDYDFDLNQVNDRASSNNGDSYKVFHTVLSTVPIFFQQFKNEILMVQGSDGETGFTDQCIETCARKCDSVCKKINQRITIYRRYVEKNFLALSNEYWFLGAFKNADDSIASEIYISGKQYDMILIFKK
ncbi:DUF6934 family protein [Dyadobacter sp. CY343]|uniref:DUF6934 family protein n=1 Tax=Dyadobacter sp. CY343 TaxID=2907299 RepID=UPI001F3AA983|nr:hypothetical protein [Dyadobacter sp. CY343]MCE7058771.1 hypothetical protein [Dyadobacter sp. CY343]